MQAVAPLADGDPPICNHLYDASVASNVQTSKKNDSLSHSFPSEDSHLPEDSIPKKIPIRRRLSYEEDSYTKTLSRRRLLYENSLTKKTPFRRRKLPYEENSLPKKIPFRRRFPSEEDSLPKKIPSLPKI